MDDSTQNKVILFVYGTLKRGECRESVIKGRFIGNAETALNYTLFSCGAYPAMIDVSKNTNHLNNKEMYTGVVGELWEVDEGLLDYPLDMIEGVPDLYDRGLVQITNLETENLKDRNIIEAITYLYQRPVKNLTHLGREW